MKKKNPKDATARNVKASNRRDYLLLKRIKGLETAIDALTMQLNILRGRITVMEMNKSGLLGISTEQSAPRLMVLVSPRRARRGGT